MNQTLKEQIIEAIKDAIVIKSMKTIRDEEDKIQFRRTVSSMLPEIRTAIASVIGEQPKIDLNLKEIESIVQELAHHHAKEYVNRYGAVHKELVDGYRSRIGYTLADLTQKTKEDEK